MRTNSVLVLNAGSSTLKFAIYAGDELGWFDDGDTVRSNGPRTCFLPFASRAIGMRR